MREKMRGPRAIGSVRRSLYALLGWRQRDREMCKVWEEVCNEWEIHRKFFSTVLELVQEACFLML